MDSCAATRPQPATPKPGAAAVAPPPPFPADRVGLGRPEAVSAQDDDARLQRIAQAAERDGDRSLARTALALRVSRAQLRLALAQLDGPAAVATAETALRAIRAEVLNRGVQLQDAWLVREVLPSEGAAWDEPALRALRWLIVQPEGWLDDAAYETARTRLRGDDALTVASLRSHYGDDDPADDEVVARLGAAAIDLLEARFARVLHDGQDRARLSALARLVVREDPLHVGARFALALDAEPARARKVVPYELDRAELLASALEYGEGSKTFARLSAVLSANPHPPATYVLAFALQARRFGLIGECRQALARVAKRDLAQPDLASAVDTLDALCAIDGSDSARFDAWAARAQPGRSFYVTDYLSAWATGQSGEVSAIQRRVGERALEEAIEHGYALGDREQLLAWLDGDHPEPQRARVRQLLAELGYDPLLLASCGGGHGASSCAHLFDAKTTLDDADDASMELGEALDALGAVRGYRLSWDALTGYADAQSWPAIARRIAATRASAEADRLFVVLAGLLHDHALDAYRAAFARDGAVLTPEQRLALELTRAGLERDPHGDALEALNAFIAPLGLTSRAHAAPADAETLQHIERDWYPGKSPLATYLRGRAYYSNGAAARAIEAWTPLSSLLAPPERARLQADLALALHLAGQSTRARELAQQARAARPDELAIVLADAYVNEGAVAATQSHARYAAALVSDPSSADAFAGFVRTWVPAGRSAAELIAFARALAPVNPSAATAAQDIEESGARELPAVLALCGEYGQSSFELGEHGVRSARLDRSALSFIGERMRNAPGGEALQWAARGAAYYGRIGKDAPASEEWAWVHFIAGNVQRARELLLLDREDDEALQHHAIALLADARARGTIDGALALVIWKNRASWSKSPLEALPALQQISANESGVQHFLCRLLVDSNLDSAALRPCADAWQHAAHDADLAAAVSYLRITAPVDAAAVGLDDRVIDAPRASWDALGGAWLNNAAIARFQQGRVDEGRLLLGAAWEHGYDLTDGLPREAVKALTNDPPLYLVAAVARRQDDGALQRAFVLATFAFMNADPERMRIYVAAARALDDGKQRDMSFTLRSYGELAQLLESDLAAHRIDRSAAHEAFAALRDSAPIAKLAARQPQSRLLALLQAEEESNQGQAEHALHALEQLIAEFPSNGLILVDAISVARVLGQNDKAAALAARGLQLDTHDARFLTLAAQAQPTGSAQAPSWALTPAAFDALAPSRPWSRYEPLAPTRQAEAAHEVELFVPSAYQPVLGNALRFVDGAGNLFFVAHGPRASHCTAPGCLAPIQREIERAGARVLWTRELDLPGGHAAQLLAFANDALSLVSVLPIGRNVYALTARAPVAQFAAQLPAFELMAQSFRWLGASLDAARAEAIRDQLWSLPADAVRARARFELVASASAAGCGLRATLASQPAAAGGDLFADVYLSAANAAQRRALVRCAQPSDAISAKLGVLALLSDEDSVHRFGAAAVREHPEQALDVARALIADGGQPRAGDDGSGNELAPYGALEILLALPEREQRSYCRDLLQASDKTLHLIGLAAGMFVDGLVADDIAQADIRSAAPVVAAMAARAFVKAPSSATLTAMRERLARIERLDSADTLALATALTATLAAQLEPSDRALLERIMKLADAVPAGELAASAHWLKTLCTTHQLGLTLAPGGSSSPAAVLADADLELAQAWLRQRRSASAAVPQGPSDVQLYQRSLAQLLPARPFSYARIDRPSAFAGQANALIDRLQYSDDARGFLARVELRAALERNGAGLFAANGALDLNRPVECAGAIAGTQFVCSAYVRDPEQLRDQLSRRGVGRDSGVKLLLGIGGTAMGLPSAAASTPALIAAWLASGSGGSWAGQTRLFGERLRTSERIEGRMLERFASIVVYDDGRTLIDHEHYLLVRDKLFVFGGTSFAHLLLGGVPAAGQALEQSPFFAAASARAGGGTLLYLMNGRGAQRAAPERGVLIALDARGAALQWLTAQTNDARAAPDLAARLPAGAAARFATSDHDGLADFSQFYQRAAAGDAHAPPARLIAKTSAAAFGWYPKRGASFWEDWVLAVRDEPQLWSAATPLGFTRGPAGEITSNGQLFYTVRDGALLISSSQALLAADPSKTSGTGTSTFSTAIDGAAVREVISQLTRADRERAAALYRPALVAGWLRTFAIASSRAPSGSALELSGRIDFELGAAHGRDPIFADHWLSIPNTLRLPRPLDAASSSHALVYTLELDHAADLAPRAFPEHPRLEVKVLDARHLALRVQPDSAGASKLDAAMRASWLADGSDLGTHSPAISALAQQIASAAPERSPSALAQRVSSWVHGNIAYEITPEHVGASELLARRRGDCSELSLLTVALLRALGVPAQLDEGLLAVGDTLGAHAWVRYYDGSRIRELDPTNDPQPVAAGHVPAKVGEIIDLLALDRARVTAVDAR